MLLSNQLCLVGLAGIGTHLGFFIREEHHLHAPTIFRVYLSLATLLFILQARYSSGTVQEAGKITLYVMGVYNLTLFTSITIYRAFCHRLHKFPGPFMAKVTKLWNVIMAMDSTNFRLMDSLYHQYGDFVRTGPNEIAIFRAEAIRAMDALGTKCIKAPWYDILQPKVSVATTRDKKLHDKRRKIWERALHTQAFQEHETRLLRIAEQLRKCIGDTAGSSINVSSMFYYYSFDVMSDLAFGEPLNMLQSEENRYVLGLLQDGMDILGPLSPVEWLVRIGYSIPGVAQNFKTLIAWSGRRLKERMQSGTQKSDIVSGLIEASQAANTLEADEHWLAGDSFAIVVAGSDTVASTLISVFYHLARDPSQIQKLRAELDACPVISDSTALRSLDHLNGTINEALRLHPALPSGGLRQTPEDGLMVAGHYIPGNVTILAPRYTIGRLESCYERPEEFIPERWYSKPEMVKDKSGFAPFSLGRYNCIGKNLALTQLRIVLALLVTEFEVAFAPGEDGVTVWRNLKDQFNSHPGRLNLVFTKRRGL